jgi:CDP-diglyceride synthetase
MVSNFFLLLPAVFAALYGEWLYFFFAAGLCIISPLYHWYKIYRPKSLQFNLYRRLDLLFAVGAFLYMYYWVYNFGTYKLIFFTLLTVVVTFFLYGRKADYKRLHPWFHIIAPILSASILISAHL